MTQEIEAAIAAARRLDILDQELWTLEAELQRHPTELGAEREAVSDFGKLVDAARRALRAQEKEVSDGEKELATAQRRRARAEDRLPYLTTASQVEAAQREIEAIRIQASEQEDAVLLGMEAVEEKGAALADVQGRHEALVEALAEREAEWEAQRPGIEARVEELTAQRVAAEAAVGPEAMRFYRMGVHASAGRSRVPRGLTSVVDDLCTTCGRHVPPRWQQEIRSFDELYGCQGCKRLLSFDLEIEAPQE